MVYYCQHIYFKIKFHGESWISVEIFIPLQLIFINSMYKRKTWQTTRKQLQQKTSDWFVWPSDFFNCFAASNHLWKSHCWGQGTLDGLLFKAGGINGVKRWVQTDVIVQNTPRCTNPTLCVFCVCYLLLVLIPANNFSFRSCVSFGWEGRNRCSWRLNFGAKLSSGGCSDPLWRMLSCGSTVPALGRFVKDPQVLSDAHCLNPRLLHLFLFPGRTQARVLLLRWEERGRFFLSACFPQKCSRPVLSRLIGLEHQLTGGDWNAGEQWDWGVFLLLLWWAEGHTSKQRGFVWWEQADYLYLVKQGVHGNLCQGSEPEPTHYKIIVSLPNQGTLHVSFIFWL